MEKQSAAQAFLAYLKGLTPEQRTALAERCDTSVEYLFQLGYGNRRPKPELAVALDRETESIVTCEEWRPDIDWNFLRTGGGAAAA